MFPTFWAYQNPILPISNEENIFDLMDKLKERHQTEIEELLKHQTQLFYKNHKWSKQVIEARKQEKIYS